MALAASASVCFAQNQVIAGTWRESGRGSGSSFGLSSVVPTQQALLKNTTESNTSRQSMRVARLAVLSAYSVKKRPFVCTVRPMHFRRPFRNEAYDVKQTSVKNREVIVTPESRIVCIIKPGGGGAESGE